MNKNIIIVTHKVLDLPCDDLILYLNEKKIDNILYIEHSFDYAKDRRSFYTWYKKGEIFKKDKSNDFRIFPSPIVYIKEFIFTLWWVIGSKTKWDLYIGMDGLCVNFGFILKSFRRVKKIIYWAIDFVPSNRFKSKFANDAYKSINITGYKYADEVWDLSPRMIVAREKFWKLDRNIYKKHQVVPYGVWTARIKTYDYAKCEKNTLVFMGNLMPKQGVQLVIYAIPKIIKKDPNFKFKIIGGGEYKKELEDLALKLNVSKYCIFLGKIEKDEDLKEEIAKSCLAIAPYVKKLDTYTYYADPGKVKEYLACGIPVLLTDIVWHAKQIEDAHCGKIITEEENTIVRDILDLMQPEKNAYFRKNALLYVKQFDYQHIFDNLDI